MADNNTIIFNQIVKTGKFGSVVDTLNTNFNLARIAILNMKGKSAYEIWLEQDENAGKSINEFWAFLTADKGYTKQVLTYEVFSALDPATVSTSTLYVHPNEDNTKYYAKLSNGITWVTIIEGDGDITGLVNDIETAKASVRKINRDLDGKLDKQEVESSGLFLSNEEGKVFMRYDNCGLDAEKVNQHFKDLVEPDLSDYAKIEDIPEQSTIIGDTDKDGIFFTDDAGRVFMQYDNENGLDANKVSEHLKGLIGSSSAGSDVMKEVDESGAFFSGSDGKVFAKYDDAKGFDVNKVSEHLKAIVKDRKSPTVENTALSMSNGDTLSLNIPDCKYNQTISFFAKLPNGVFGENDSSTTLIINRGINNSNFGNIGSTRIIVTHDEISVIDAYENSSIVNAQHNLAISDFIIINVSVGKYIDESKITIITNDPEHPSGYSADITFRGCRRGLKAYVTGNSNVELLTDCHLSWSCSDLNRSLWVFGDSYLEYWPIKAMQLGYGNAMFDGHGGRGSSASGDDIGAKNSFDLCLSLATPKTVFWCMGANDFDKLDRDGVSDGDDSRYNNWLNAINHVIEVCEHKNIELVLYTIHNGIANAKQVDENNTSVKIDYIRSGERKNTWIKASGVRYVDVAGAITDPNKSITDKDDDGFLTGDFYDEMESLRKTTVGGEVKYTGDLVHPSTFGSWVIANYIIAHLPELKDEQEYNH